MNSKIPKVAITSAEAEAAFDALDRRARGEPPIEESALDAQEVDRLQALLTPLDAEFESRMADQLLRSLHAASPAMPARPVRQPRPRWWRYTAQAAAMAAAACFAVWVIKPFSFAGKVEFTQLAPSEASLSVSTARIAQQLPLGSCVNLQLSVSPKSGNVSDSLTAQVYIEQGKRAIRWDMDLHVDQRGSLIMPQCMPLPAEVTPGSWELVVLVGYPGRLWLQGDGALVQSRGHATGTFHGLEVVRYPVRVSSTSG